MTLTKSAALAAALALGGLLPGLAFAAPAPQDEQADVEIVLDRNVRTQVRAAYPASSGLGALPSETRDAANEFESTLRADLEGSGVFLLQGPEQLSVLRLTGDKAADAEQYRSLGNEILIETAASREGDRLVVEGKVSQLDGQLFILGKRYRGSYAVARRMAHTFADEIIRNFTARPGLTLTSIAFSSDRDGGEARQEVYIMDYDGWNQRPLTAHMTLSFSPDFDHRGDYLAYVSYLDGAPGIYSVELSSGNKKPLITSSDLDISPAYGPDGRIAFSRSVGRGNSEIFVSNADGSNLQQLTRSSGIDTNPAWSTDGRELAFTSSRGGSPQIYVMSADGSNLRRVTFEGDYNDGAAWDPKSARIVHATRRGNRFDLAITDLVTLESKALKRSEGSHESPSFSPDGRKVAYASTRGGNTQIYVLDLADGTETQLTRTGNNRGPAWSKFVQ